jgi:hypothetical protein
MADGGMSDQIARIESDIEGLAKTLDGCRKTILFSKVAIAGGGIWMLAYFLGAIRLDPTTVIGAIAAIIGGVVLFGSNSSTSKQAMAAMKAAEMQRAKLIDMIDVRTVGASQVPRPLDHDSLSRGSGA